MRKKPLDIVARPVVRSFARLVGYCLVSDRKEPPIALGLHLQPLHHDAL